MQQVVEVRAWGQSSAFIILSQLNKADLRWSRQILRLKKKASSSESRLSISVFSSISPPVSFFLVPASLSLPLPASFSESLALHLYPPRCHTFSPSLLTLPFLLLLHSFFPWLFWVPLPSLLLLLLLKPRDAAHLRAAAVYRACLSPCVAATTAVNLVQTRCLFYSLALSEAEKKKKRERPNKKAKDLLHFLFDGSLPLFTTDLKKKEEEIFSTSTAWGGGAVSVRGIFQTMHDKNGDFLKIASMSFRRRTLLLLGHHSTATDGTSITDNHTTRVDLGKSVVTAIGAWLISSPQQRKWQPYIRNHKHLLSDEILLAQKAVFVGI